MVRVAGPRSLRRLLEGSERIARDLHDTVLQRLFVVAGPAGPGAGVSGVRRA